LFTADGHSGEPDIRHQSAGLPATSTDFFPTPRPRRRRWCWSLVCSSGVHRRIA